MSQTLIQKYSSTIVSGFIEKSISLKGIKHDLLKGELRELFVKEILESFLTSQFGIGSGIIVNQKGDQSNQIDIIIYDTRLLPPFITNQHLGVFPAETVLATIEIKSNLRSVDISASEKKCKSLFETVYSPESTIYNELFYPTCAILGFYGNSIKNLKDKSLGKSWLNDNIKYIKYLCLINKYSWINMKNNGWTCEISDKYKNETKRFIAVLLDNLRTNSETRFRELLKDHKDWLGIYLRDQNIFK